MSYLNMLLCMIGFSCARVIIDRSNNLQIMLGLICHGASVNFITCFNQLNLKISALYNHRSFIKCSMGCMELEVTSLPTFSSRLLPSTDGF